MSNKKGKAMSNLPIHYIQAMEELQEENNKLRLELKELKTKVNEFYTLLPDVLNDILKYIKSTEVAIEGEWGVGRTFNVFKNII